MDVQKQKIDLSIKLKDVFKNNVEVSVTDAQKEDCFNEKPFQGPFGFVRAVPAGRSVFISDGAQAEMADLPVQIRTARAVYSGQNRPSRGLRGVPIRWKSQRCGCSFVVP